MKTKQAYDQFWKVRGIYQHSCGLFIVVVLPRVSSVSSSYTGNTQLSDFLADSLVAFNPRIDPITIFTNHSKLVLMPFKKWHF